MVAEGTLPSAQREWKFLIREPAATPGEGMGDAPQTSGSQPQQHRESTGSFSKTQLLHNPKRLRVSERGVWPAHFWL